MSPIAPARASTKTINAADASTAPTEISFVRPSRVGTLSLKSSQSHEETSLSRRGDDDCNGSLPTYSRYVYPSIPWS